MKKYLPFLFALVAGTCWAANPGALFDFLAGGIVDEDGAPLTGGTAYFYDAGYAGNAAHARNIWTSANRTGTATSIILGGTGHPPGGALVYGDGLYDVVVKDSATNTVFTALAVEAFYGGEDQVASGDFTVSGDLTVMGASTNFRAAIVAVDGSGSGIDADKLDTYHATDFVSSSTYSALDVLTKIKTVDGAASGLDAQFFAGLATSSFATLTGTQTLTNKTFGIASSGWVSCAAATDTAVLSIGTGKTDNYTFTYEVKDATATQHICINSFARPSDLVYLYYDEADGYVRCYNNATDTVSVRVHLWPVQ